MAKPKQKKSAKRILWEYVQAIVTALILALIIRTFIVQAFKIPSGSMKPTLQVGDHILVNKFIYGVRVPFKGKKVLVWSTPSRGDIIVFKYPKDPSRDFIKRVIGVGGDTISEKDKVLYVNGKRADEPYAKHVESDIKPGGFEPRDNFGPIVVPQGKYFVMGDNRDQSYDSRYWGFVDLDEIKGKALIIYWSWDGDRKFPRMGRMGHLVH
jgi:signal peptidase I